jgi:hypothetical protein
MPLDLALAVPGAFARSRTDLDALRRACARLAVRTFAIEAAPLERLLGAPVPTVPLEPPPADGVAFGLLELEEDVLRDSYELARETFQGQLRAWRTDARTDALDTLRQDWQRDDVSFGLLHVPDLVLWNDDEVEYACRVARALGAGVLSTRRSLGGSARLATVSGALGIRLTIESDEATGDAELDRILGEAQHVSAAIDVGAWLAGGHGTPLPAIERHAARLTHIRMDDTAWPAPGPAGLGSPVHDLMRHLRTAPRPLPIVIDVDRDDRNEWLDEVTRAVAWCRSVH